MKTFNRLLTGAVAFTVFLFSGSSLSYGAAGDLYIGNLSSQLTRLTSTGASNIFATGFDPYGIAFNKVGDAFVASSDQAAIFRVTPDGTVTLFASGLGDPLGLVFDSLENLYTADFTANAIVKFAPDGSRTTFASNISHPDGITMDSTGNLFVSGYSSGRITKISPAGVKTTFATALSGPVGVACDALGNLFVAERDGGRIDRFSPDGTNSLFSADFGSPYGLVFDPAGNLFASDQFTGQIIKFAPSGTPQVVASMDPEVGFLAIERATGKLLNISTRLRILTGDNVLIGGFIVTGDQPKRIIVRGMGPSLSSSGLSGVIADPTIELFDSNNVSVANNNDWKETQRELIEASGFAPANDLEAAIIATLNPGAYTAIEAGRLGATGIGIVEVYDLDPTPNSTIANISTRGFVGTAEDVMIGGFVAGSGNGARVVVRGLGPSLAQVGVPNPLGNPVLELRNSDGLLLGANDNWREAQETALQGTGLVPSDDLESAMTLALGPGPYTAIVYGQGGTTGVALVDVFALP